MRQRLLLVRRIHRRDRLVRATDVRCFRHRVLIGRRDKLLRGLLLRLCSRLLRVYQFYLLVT